MAWIFRLTALRDQWGGAIKKGETFTLVQSSSSPNSNDLLIILNEAYRILSSIDSSFLNNFKMGYFVFETKSNAVSNSTWIVKSPFIDIMLK